MRGCARVVAVFRFLPTYSGARGEYFASGGCVLIAARVVWRSAVRACGLRSCPCARARLRARVARLSAISMGCLVERWAVVARAVRRGSFDAQLRKHGVRMS